MNDISTIEEGIDLCCELSRMLKLSRAEHHLWLTLIFINCVYFDSAVYFTASINFLKKLTGLSNNTIIKARNRLIDKHLIKCRRTAGKVTIYMLTTPRIKVLKQGGVNE